MDPSEALLGLAFGGHPSPCQRDGDDRQYVPFLLGQVLDQVEEGQHLPGVRTDDFGSRTVTVHGAEQPRKPAELAPEDAMDEHHLLSVDAGPGNTHRDASTAAAFRTASSGVIAGRPMRFIRSSLSVNSSPRGSRRRREELLALYAEGPARTASV
ncbi:hypothetical protein ACFYPA_32815 [Streptomyces sp. NPDC005775]|uniref:hypothetical protein n=1 Tax=Streptomyces sp. NPDC005775 TaxID=3364729 RepID=UPI0036C69865